MVFPEIIGQIACGLRRLLWQYLCHGLPYELIVLPLHCSALFIHFFMPPLAALGGPFITVPLARVTSCGVIPTKLAEIYGEQVRLIVITVPFEFTPLVELGVGTETAPDLGNRPTCPVGLYCHKERLVSHSEVFQDAEAFLLYFLLPFPLHCAINALRDLLHTPLYPGQQSGCSFYCPPMLETQPQQRLMVNPLRMWDCETLCSASSFLGFAIGVLFWDPGDRLVVGPRCGPRCL